MTVGTVTVYGTNFLVGQTEWMLWWWCPSKGEWVNNYGSVGQPLTDPCTVGPTELEGVRISAGFTGPWTYDLINTGRYLMDITYGTMSVYGEIGGEIEVINWLDGNGLPVYEIGEEIGVELFIRNTGNIPFKPKYLPQLMQRRLLVDYDDLEKLWYTATYYVSVGGLHRSVHKLHVCKSPEYCGGNAGTGDHWGRCALHGILEDGNEYTIDDLSYDTAGVAVATISGVVTPDARNLTGVYW